MELMMFVSRSVRSAATLILLVSGVAKLFGWSPEFLLPQYAHYALALIELMIAVLLWSRRLQFTAILCLLALAISGQVAAWTMASQHCGCFGPLYELTAHQRAILSSALGVLAAMALGAMPDRRGEQVRRLDVQVESRQ